MFLEEVADGVGGLGAVGEPLLGEVRVDPDHFGVACGIVDADLLDVLSVTRFSGIGGDDAVERCLLCAHSGESEFDHMCFSFCLSAE